VPDIFNDSLIDSYGRRVTYLRVSLTDRCNYRCLYCMPPEGAAVMPKDHILTDDAIVQFVRVAATLGVERIRLTGGEPLLRPGLVELVSRLAKIPGVKDLGLTTNGSRLTALAVPLREAGLTRINVSLDSLEADAFEAITGGGRLSSVMEGIDAAMNAGLPLKINVVVLRGMNEGELLDFARLALRRGVQVRFIEFMPLCGTGWRPELVFPLTEVKAIMRAHFCAESMGRGSDVADLMTISDGRRTGEVGFIATLSEPFCDTCSRIRLTADGKIRPCLFSREDFAVSELLKTDVPDEMIAERIRYAVTNKPRGNAYDDAMREGGQADYSAYAGLETATPSIRSIGG